MMIDIIGRFRAYGRYVLGYVIARVLEVIFLIAVLGLTASFIGSIDEAGGHPPIELSVALVLSILGIFWPVFTVFTLWEGHIRYLKIAAIDMVTFVPFIAAVVYVAYPVVSTDCSALPTNNQGSLSAELRGTNFTTSNLTFTEFMRADQVTCNRVESAWDLMICVCVTIVFGAVSTVFLHLGRRRQQQADAQAYDGSKSNSGNQA